MSDTVDEVVAATGALLQVCILVMSRFSQVSLNEFHTPSPHFQLCDERTRSAMEDALPETENQVVDAVAATAVVEGSDQEPNDYASQSPTPTVKAWDTQWDAPWVAGRPRLAVTRVILLVRHGHYMDSAPNDTSRVLTALGRLQAAATGARLRARLESLGCDLPTCIIHSSMTRAVQTAQLIRDAAFPTLPLSCDPDLREGAPAVPEPNWWRPSPTDVARDSIRIERAFKRYFHRAVGSRDGAQHDAFNDSGAPVETPAADNGGAGTSRSAVAQPELSTPAAPSMQAMRHAAEVYVAHGNVIRFFVLRALQLDPTAWLRLVVPHGSITTVAITPDGDVLLQGLGDCGHLEADLVS
jgi:serine/threonine-protein phosphatase PGAM5